MEYQYTPVQSLFSAQLITVQKFTPPLILLGLKKIQLLSVDEVSHPHLNAGEALNERIINTHSLHFNNSGQRKHNYEHSLASSQ